MIRANAARVAALAIAFIASWLAITGSSKSAKESYTGSYWAPDQVIYSGGLASGWQDWSWAKHEIKSARLLYHDRSAIRMEPEGFRGIYLHTDGLDTNGSVSLWLWVNGGAEGGQHLNIAAVDGARKFLSAVDLGKYTSGGRIPAGRWTLAIIPLDRLRAKGAALTGFVIQDATGKRQPDVYIADITLKGSGPKPDQSVTVTLDLSGPGRPISPLIYGLAGGGPEVLRDLRLGSIRWGGNPASRYNWELGNSWNAARDWGFRNGNYGSAKPEDRVASAVADRFVANARASKTAALLTIPTIGYVAKDDNNGTHSIGVPNEGGVPVSPGSEAIPGYDPRANQQRTSVRSFARKKAPFAFPPNVTDGAVYQDEWVDHLVKKFGKASEGGVRLYAMDNEPDLWAVTHTDIHPVRIGYDDLLSTFLDYSGAVKAVDPTAEITGPVSWGWTGYIHSPRDQGHWNDRPDRRAHGDMELIPWFLDQVKRHDQRSGKRSLDVLDIHYYPQTPGVYNGAKPSPQASAARLQSTRSLWDPSYKDESWIGEPVNLIPRMRGWIDRYYPGTKLGITEWNWGADNTIGGGLAVADVLGIFGREGLYIANYFTAPKENSPGYFAFKIFRNADDAGHGFGDRSILTTSSMPETVAGFGSIDSTDGSPVIVLLNKEPGAASRVTLQLKGGKPATVARGWRYDESELRRIVRIPDMQVTDGGKALAIKLPAYSMTLLRFNAR